MGGAFARSVRPRRRMRVASTTRSSRSATSPPTRASAATRRSRSSPALKPVFDPEGTTTAGQRAGRQRRRVVRRRLLGGVREARRGSRCSRRSSRRRTLPDDFAYLARTPARAGHRALEKAGKSIGDVERVEINEAFSSVALNSTRMLGADEEIVNVNGGAVALGHPIGAAAGGSSGRWCTSCAATAAGSAWRRSAPAAARATRC